VVLLGWSFRDKIPFNEHDEPVVVDNGPIRISRKGATPMKENNDSKRWEIHHSAPLATLHSWYWDPTEMNDIKWKESPTPALSLSLIGDIDFATIRKDNSGPTAQFTLRRDQFWEFHHPQKVRLKGRFGFKKEMGREELQPEDAAYEEHRISSVQVGDQVICFRESDTPVVKSAANACANTKTPVAIEVQLCVTPEKCSSPQYVPQPPSSPSDGR